MKNFNDIIESYLQKSSNKGLDAFNKILKAIAKVKGVSTQDVLNYNSFAFSNEDSLQKAKESIIKKLEMLAKECGKDLNLKEFFNLYERQCCYYDVKKEKWITEKHLLETIYYENKDKYNWKRVIPNGYNEDSYKTLYNEMSSFEEIKNSLIKSRFKYISDVLSNEWEFISKGDDNILYLYDLFGNYNYYQAKHKSHSYHNDNDFLYIHKELNKYTKDACIVDTIYLPSIYKNTQLESDTWRFRMKPTTLFNRMLKDNKLKDIELEKFYELLIKEKISQR